MVSLVTISCQVLLAELAGVAVLTGVLYAYWNLYAAR